jgi:hypothetical protein
MINSTIYIEDNNLTQQMFIICINFFFCDDRSQTNVITNYRYQNTEEQMKIELPINVEKNNEKWF